MSFDVSTLIGRRATDVSNRMSMGDLLRRVARSMPDKIALVGDAGASETGRPVRITFGDAADLVDRAAAGFQAQGLRPGDVCVVVCENSVEALLTKIALARAGVVVAPLNPSLPDDVVKRLFDRIRPKALITETGLLHRFTADGSPAAGLRIPYVIDIGKVEDVDSTSGPRTDLPTFGGFARAHGVDVQEPEVAGDDIWQLLFTSGSTSDPKAAMVSHSNTYIEALSWTATLARGLRSENDTVVGTGLPMIYHVGDAMAYASWFNSGTVVLARRPDTHAIAQLIGKEGITVLWGGLPQFLRNLLQTVEGSGDYDMSSLRTVIFGWAPLDSETFERYQDLVDHEIGLVAIIGQTELVVSHRFWLNEHRDLLSSDEVSPNYIGLPHAALGASVFDISTQWQVVDEHGDMGEVRYQSPALMAGYFEDEEATKKAINGGWFHSGDVFGIGPNSQRIMLDRLKDVIKSGGENVSSLRVEAALETHEDVERAAVIGVQDQKWGEAVTAVVVLKDGARATGATLIDYCKTRLARFEVPKSVKFVDALPMSVGGKLQKFKLADLIHQ